MLCGCLHTRHLPCPSNADRTASPGEEEKPSVQTANPPGSPSYLAVHFLSLPGSSEKPKPHPVLFYHWIIGESAVSIGEKYSPSLNAPSAPKTLLYIWVSFPNMELSNRVAVRRLRETHPLCVFSCYL